MGAERGRKSKVTTLLGPESDSHHVCDLSRAVLPITGLGKRFF